MRFPEFEGEWENCAFSDIGTFSKGIGISKEQLTEDGTPCILYGELYTKYKNEVIKEVKNKTSINANGLVFSKVNDVIIPSSGETAIDISTACCVMLDNILLGGDLNIIRPEKHNGSFISYQLNGKRKYDIAKIAQGSSIIHLYNDSLKKIKLNVPNNIKEEEKIVSLLSRIDDRISTQSQIIEELKAQKIALRNKLYEQITRIGESEQIVNLLTYEQPTNYIVTNTDYSNETSLIPVLTANKAFILGYIDENFGIYNKGECIIFDDFTMDLKYVDFQFKVKSSAIKILTAKQGVNLRFIYEYLSFLKLTSADHKRHYISEIEPRYISLPEIDIQNNTANVLLITDKKISLEIKQYYLLVKQKKYLLQQMFI